MSPVSGGGTGGRMNPARRKGRGVSSPAVPAVLTAPAASTHAAPVTPPAAPAPSPSALLTVPVTGDLDPLTLDLIQRAPKVSAAPRPARRTSMSPPTTTPNHAPAPVPPFQGATRRRPRVSPLALLAGAGGVLAAGWFLVLRGRTTASGHSAPTAPSVSSPVAPTALPTAYPTSGMPIPTTPTLPQSAVPGLTSIGGISR